MWGLANINWNTEKQDLDVLEYYFLVENCILYFICKTPYFSASPTYIKIINSNYIHTYLKTCFFYLLISGVVFLIGVVCKNQFQTTMYICN